MRKVVFEDLDGLAFECRALTRGEVKKLRAAGHEIFDFDGQNAVRGTMDAVLDVVFPDNAALDDLPFPRALKVYRGIMEATMGAEEEVKNS